MAFLSPPDICAALLCFVRNFSFSFFLLLISVRRHSKQGRERCGWARGRWRSLRDRTPRYRGILTIFCRIGRYSSIIHAMDQDPACAICRTSKISWDQDHLLPDKRARYRGKWSGNGEAKNDALRPDPARLDFFLSIRTNPAAHCNLN